MLMEMKSDSELRQRNVGKKTLDDNTLPIPCVKTDLKDEEDTYKLYNTYHFLGLFILLSGLSYIVFTYGTYLPSSKPFDAIITEFSGDRARKHMEAIAAIGPRPSGSYANDIEAVRYIFNELNKIKENADPHYHVEIELQTVSGSFAFFRKSNYIDLGFTSTYGNITNVIAKISPKDSGKVFLLANAHYDTVMNSEGASDDTVSCAVLIESFRALSKTYSEKLKHGVIFLFNGAEEGGLSGGHGFIQHRWFSLVKAVVNVEAAGSGGREFVFQTGPDHPWMIDIYASYAPYPYASIVAQEIFQSGIIPSDTDFRVFIDYGKLVGIDIAFINNGYVYHTRYDDAKSIPSGSIQRAGDNIFGVIKGIISSVYLENPERYKHGASVFFDVLGIFVIHYPQRLHSLMNNMICAVVFIFIIRHLLKGNKKMGYVSSRTNVSPLLLLLATLTILCSWIFAFALPAAVAYVLMKLKVMMTWYSYPMFAILLYGLPALFGMLLGHYVGNMLIKKISSPNILSFIYGHLLIYSSLLFYANHKGLLSSFILWFWVLFPFIFAITYELISLHASKNLVYSLLLIFYTPPSLLSLYYLDTLYTFFGPLLGRTGPKVPSELVIALLSAFSVVVVMTYLMCVYHNTVNMKTFLFFIGICCFVPKIYVLTGYSPPYSVSNRISPKRLWLQHTLRTFHSSNGSIERQDSGIWMQPMDATALQPLEHIDLFKKAEIFECDGSYCGLPYYYTMRGMIKEHWYLRGENPDGDFQPLSTNIYKRVVKHDGDIRFNFDIDGPDHMMLFLTLKPNVTLDWSLYKSEDGHIYKMNDYLGGYTYIVFYSHGYHSESWKFWIEFKKSTLSPYLAELGIARHYLHGKKSRTTFLKKAINSLPDWVCDNSWTSNYDSFTLQ